MPVPHGGSFRTGENKGRRVPYDVFKGRREPLDQYANAKIKLFYIVEEFEDYLVCHDGARLISGEPDTLKATLVAKPYLMRQSSLHDRVVAMGGKNIDFTTVNYDTITAVDDDAVEATETWRITPSYAPYVASDTDGETILAAFRNTGIYDVGGTGSLGTTRAASAHVLIKWEDINSAGRCWAKVLA